MKLSGLRGERGGEGGWGWGLFARFVVLCELVLDVCGLYLLIMCRRFFLLGLFVRLLNCATGFVVSPCVCHSQACI